jgi:hypothetical protein
MKLCVYDPVANGCAVFSFVILKPSKANAKFVSEPGSGSV